MIAHPRKPKPSSGQVLEPEAVSPEAPSGGLNPNLDRKVKEAFWQGSLGYPHAVVLAGYLVAVGVALHATIGYRIPPMLNPVMWLLALAVPGSLIAGRVGRKNRVIHWLTGIPVAVVVTSAVGILGLVGGIVPLQTLQEQFQVESVWVSWPFVLLVALMLVNLVGSVGKRCWPINYTNVVYFTTHAGLAIAIIGGAGSSLFLERDIIVLFHGQPTTVAVKKDNTEVKLPFEITLNEFVLTSFPPVLALAELDPKVEGGVDVTPGEDLLKEGLTTDVAGYKIKVKKYLPKAIFGADGWQAAPWKTAPPAAELAVTTPKGETFEGWVSCGSVDAPPNHIRLGETSAIVMPDPRPKEFRSDITIKNGAGEEKHTIKVNEPITRDGWTLYQLSYDQKMGAASQYSTLEAVRDPGIGVVYFGMGLLILGSVLHLWNGVGSTNGRGSKK